MTRLVMFEANNRTTVYVNPEHVSALASLGGVYGGTRITLQNGKYIDVSGSIDRIEYRLRREKE